MKYIKLEIDEKLHAEFKRACVSIKRPMAAMIREFMRRTAKRFR